MPLPALQHNCVTMKLVILITCNEPHTHLKKIVSQSKVQTPENLSGVSERGIQE